MHYTEYPDKFICHSKGTEKVIHKKNIINGGSTLKSFKEGKQIVKSVEFQATINAAKNAVMTTKRR